MDFENWLKQNKGFSHKGSHDIKSRVRRVQRILGKDTIELSVLELLPNCLEFKNLSTPVRSQLRRAVKLYCEYHHK